MNHFFFQLERAMFLSNLVSFSRTKKSSVDDFTILLIHKIS